MIKLSKDYPKPPGRFSVYKRPLSSMILPTLILKEARKAVKQPNMPSPKTNAMTGL